MQTHKKRLDSKTDSQPSPQTHKLQWSSLFLIPCNLNYISLSQRGKEIFHSRLQKRGASGHIYFSFPSALYMKPKN